MPKPAWAAASTDLTIIAITEAQWSYYAELPGKMCKSCTNVAAAKNWSCCAAHQQGWWPTDTDVGSDLVTIELDRDFEGAGTIKSKALCACGHIQCRRIGHVPNAADYALFHVLWVSCTWVR